ncbi:MAG TPA: hypothetical protein VMG12_33850 [Polyangiaceae bacterium]|nr:hypothetical protein [Polyangiaceae bacterium]
MKRLVDETTDELTRSLLSAGIEHRPPPGNKAQVIVALGAGGAVGLFSSNAFAWLSTTAGKATLVSVTAVSVAVGAVWVAAPAERQASSTSPSNGNVTAQLRASNEAAPSLPEAASPQAAGSGAVSPPSAEAASVVATTVDDARADEGRPKASARRERARRLAAKRAAAREAAKEAAAEASSEASPAAQAPDEPSAEQAALDTEVRLVDDMHWAARRNDHAALGRFLEQYRSAFPDGQLKKEVAEFAARLERPDMSVKN